LAVSSFFGKGSDKQAGCPTKRAPDVWESAAFPSIFLASGFSYISSIVHAHPHAGNANRWQAEPKSKCKTVFDAQVLFCNWLRLLKVTVGFSSKVLRVAESLAN
jgi:hypothetical protein